RAKAPFTSSASRAQQIATCSSAMHANIATPSWPSTNCARSRLFSITDDVEQPAREQSARECDGVTLGGVHVGEQLRGSIGAVRLLELLHERRLAHPLAGQP